MSATRRHVLIVDDVAAARQLLAEAVTHLLPDATIVTAASLAEAGHHLTGPIDLALIDLALPDGRGWDLIRKLKARPGVIAAAVTVMDDDASIEQALATGADGYLLKDAEPALLRQRIERLLAGEPSLSPSIARRVLARFAAQAPADDNLSAREREILSLVARGLRAPEVATLLTISPHTVRDHIKSIYRKLDVSSRAEATLEAQRRRLT